MGLPWYFGSVVYSIDVATFGDSSGDGWGDLGGVRERLDYLRGLGVDCIWLQPFYPTPYRDGGYDVTDHLGVDPRYGDIADFTELMDSADKRGIRVMIDLVANHTSIDHPWFQQARADPDSAYRDYYIWSDSPVETDAEPNFPGVEDNVWTFDETAEQYYHHVFYSHEPGLNIANPAVREEIFRSMAFWLRLGVAGFRVDAAPYLLRKAAEADPTDGGHWLFRQMHELVTARRADGILLAETDLPAHEYGEYFGDSDQLNLLFNFYLNNYYFLALTREEAEPLRRALQALPRPPQGAQYALWARNHDEADLERLSRSERAEVMAQLAPEQEMRIYGRGIRRRLAPMLGGERRRVELAHSLIFSLPGVPVLRYGEEIGMGEDLSLPEREAVRTPMQWTERQNAGFSSAEPEHLVRPIITEGPYSVEHVNVHRQLLKRDSLLATVGAMVRTRLGLREIAHGSWRILDVHAEAVLALRYDLQDSILITVTNLSSRPVTVELPAEEDTIELVDVFADASYDPPTGQHCKLDLRGYGYRWLRNPQSLLAAPATGLSEQRAHPPRPLHQDGSDGKGGRPADTERSTARG